MTPGGRRIRIGFVTTHPIQYHAGWFKAIAAGGALDLEVLYCHDPAPAEQADAGFGVPFSWDVPLLDGYRYRFLENVSRQPSTGAYASLDTPELRTLIQQHTYDAVVVNGWHYKSAWQAIRACWHWRIPVLVRSDSHLHTERHPIKTLLKAVPYRWFVRRLNGCLAVGRWSSDYFRHYDARPDRIFVVPHAIDRAFATDSLRLAPQRAEFRDRWRLAADQTTFLFAGKFTAKKRPLDFVRAIERASRRSPKVAGLMVGDGPLRGECEDLVNQRHLPITFAGFLNQSGIVPAYLAADALVLPSDGRETWGMVVNEAMTCAKACLVSDRVGCGPDLVRTGETGFTFPLGDVDALSAQMTDCAGRPDALAAMGHQARAAIAGYSVTAAANSLRMAVEKVLASA